MRNLAKITRSNQNLVFYALMLMGIGAFLFSCSDDDDDDNGPSTQPTDTCSDPSAATDNRFSTFTLSFPDGSDTTIVRETQGMPNFIGSGNYPGTGFWRQVRVFTHLGTVHFRVSMPTGTNIEETLVQEHELNSTSLGNPFSVNEVYPELSIPGNDTILGNASGTVTLMKNVESGSGNISIYGTIDADFTTTNTTFNMRGCFWHPDFEW